MKTVWKVVQTFCTLIMTLFVIHIFLVFPVYAVNCTYVPGGDTTISSSCSFPGTVDGLDNGTGTTNTAVLTVNNNATLTVQGNQTIAVGSLQLSGGGKIVIISGGVIKFKIPLWMTDADSDGWPATTTQYAQTSAPTNGRRRNLMTSITQTDANDAIVCTTDGASAGICKTCLNGGPSNAAAGTDPNNDCFVSVSYPLSSANAKTCNQVCAALSMPDANCNGAGACANHTGTCSSIGTDYGAASNGGKTRWTSALGCFVQFGLDCTTTTGNNGVTCTLPAAWTYCQCH